MAVGELRGATQGKAAKRRTSHCKPMPSRMGTAPAPHSPWTMGSGLRAGRLVFPGWTPRVGNASTRTSITQSSQASEGGSKKKQGDISLCPCPQYATVNAMGNLLSRRHACARHLPRRRREGWAGNLGMRGRNVRSCLVRRDGRLRGGTVISQLCYMDLIPGQPALMQATWVRTGARPLRAQLRRLGLLDLGWLAPKP